MKPVIIIISVLAFLLIAVWGVFTFVPQSDEDQIHGLIMKTKESIESGSVLDLSDMIASNYKDKSGSDSVMVIQSTRNFVQATESRSLHIFEIEINVEDDTASSSIICKMNLKTNQFASNMSLLPLINDVRLQVDMEWAKIDGTWKLIYSEVNPA